MSDTPEWLNTDTAAAYIGIGPAPLRRLVDRGKVVAFQVGRVRRYRRGDLDTFLESARVRPATRPRPSERPTTLR